MAIRQCLVLKSCENKKLSWELCALVNRMETKVSYIGDSESITVLLPVFFKVVIGHIDLEKRLR